MTDLPEINYMSTGNLINIIIGSGSESEQFVNTNHVDHILSQIKDYNYFLEDGDEEFASDILDSIYRILENKKVSVGNGLLKDNDNLYFEGLESYPIPRQLRELIVLYKEQGLDTTPLKNFYNWLLLNPNQEAQEDLLQYVQDYGIVLTDNGYMMLYKGVKEVDTLDKEDAQWIATKYIDEISKGNNPDEVYVINTQEDVIYLSDEGIYEGDTVLGTLREVYTSLHERSVSDGALYTDFHSESMEYEVGKVFSEDRELCDPDSSVGCSTGLHVGSHDYVDSYYSHRPNSAIFGCLVNPMNVVAVPKHDNSKIRTCEFKALGLMEQTEHGFKKVDNLVLSELQDEYLEYNMEQLPNLNGSGEVKDNIRRVVEL